MTCTNCGQGVNRIGSSGSGCCNLETMDVDTPLEKIRNGDEDFCFVEITNKICESLMNDEGINPSLKHSNSDCDDLSALNDLATGNLHNALMVLNMCDVDEYKCWLDSLLSWQWNVDKATICAVCGLWKNIHDLWADLDKIWQNINDIWIAIRNINQQIENIQNEIIKLWNDSKSIWQNIGDIVIVTNNLKEKDGDLQKQIDEINKKMPGGFSTLVSKVLWQGNAHAGQTFKLSEPLSNFDLVRVKYNVGGSQYSTDLLPGYFNPNLANVATYSGIDYAGDYEFRACAGLEGTSTALSSLVMTASKSTLVYYNLATGKIDQWFKGTSTNNKTGECIISRIEGLREISYK